MVHFGVRLLQRDGFRESAWTEIAPGVTVLTGRNNVGKTRLLRSVSNLTQAFEGVKGIPVPEFRVQNDQYTIEADVAGEPAPRRWSGTESGQPDFEITWTQDPAETYRMTDAKRSTQYGAFSRSSFPAQLGSLPLYAEIRELLKIAVYFQPQRVPETVANTAPEAIPSADSANLGRVIYHHRGNETDTMRQIDALMSEMFPEIDRVLAGPSGQNLVTVTVHDRFANRNVPLSEAGTGVAQLLHFVSSVLLMPPGRIMLVEEPTAYLHPAAEKLLATFIRAHPEHAYVISTHSPIFVSAVQPDRVLLIRRDQQGIQVSPVLGPDLTMRHVLEELGIQPGELALSERLLFVEGVADVGTYPILMTKLGWDPVSHSCALIQLQGFGASRTIRETMTQLSNHIHVRHLIVLDGDQRPRVGELPNLTYLPVPELENILTRDPAAVSAGLAQVWMDEHPDADEIPWTPKRVDDFLRKRSRDANLKGSKALTDLAHSLGLEYRKAVHGPAIASHLDAALLYDLKPVFERLFTKEI